MPPRRRAPTGGTIIGKSAGNGGLFHIRLRIVRNAHSPHQRIIKKLFRAYFKNLDALTRSYTDQPVFPDIFRDMAERPIPIASAKLDCE